MPGIILENQPLFIGIPINGFVDIRFKLKIKDSERDATIHQTFQLQDQGPLTRTPLTTLSVPYPGLSYVTAELATSLGADLNGLNTNVWLISIEAFANSIQSFFLNRLLAIQGSTVQYRKMFVSLHISKEVGLVELKAPLQALRRYTDYKFTLRNNVVGALGNAPIREGALSINCYPVLQGTQQSVTVNAEGVTTRTRTNIIRSSLQVSNSGLIDRPNRFLIPGVAIPSERLINNASINILESFFTSSIPIMDGPEAAAITLRPVIENMGDLVGVRAAQSVGFTRLAGMVQRRRRAGGLESERLEKNV